MKPELKFVGRTLEETEAASTICFGCGKCAYDGCTCPRSQRERNPKKMFGDEAPAEAARCPGGVHKARKTRKTRKTRRNPQPPASPADGMLNCQDVLLPASPAGEILAWLNNEPNWLNWQGVQPAPMTLEDFEGIGGMMLATSTDTTDAAECAAVSEIAAELQGLGSDDAQHHPSPEMLQPQPSPTSNDLDDLLLMLGADL